MTLICMKMKLHAELIFISKVSHLDSFRNNSEQGKNQPQTQLMYDTGPELNTGHIGER